MLPFCWILFALNQRCKLSMKASSLFKGSFVSWWERLAAIAFMKELFRTRFRCLKRIFIVAGFQNLVVLRLGWIFATGFQQHSNTDVCLHVIWLKWRKKSQWSHVSSVFSHRANLLNHSCTLFWDLKKPLLPLARLKEEMETARKKEKESLTLKCKCKKPFWFPAVKQIFKQNLSLTFQKANLFDRISFTSPRDLGALIIKLANSKY